MVNGARENKFEWAVNTLEVCLHTATLESVTVLAEQFARQPPVIDMMRTIFFGSSLKVCCSGFKCMAAWIAACKSASLASFLSKGAKAYWCSCPKHMYKVPSTAIRTRLQVWQKCCDMGVM